MDEQLIVLAEPKAVSQDQRLIRLIYCPNCRWISEHTTEQKGDREICTCRNCGRQVEFNLRED